MKRRPIYRNRAILAEQVIFAWLSLTIGTIIFTLLSLILSAFLENRDQIVIISFLFVAPLIAIANIFIHRKHYLIAKQELLEHHKQEIGLIQSLVENGRNLLDSSRNKSISYKINDIEAFRDELWTFIHVAKASLSREKTEINSMAIELQKTYDELIQYELLLAKRILELRRDQAIIKKLDNIALPEETEQMSLRDFTKWNAWPLRNSDRLKAKLASARLAQ